MTKISDLIESIPDASLPSKSTHIGNLKEDESKNLFSKQIGSAAGTASVGDFEFGGTAKAVFSIEAINKANQGKSTGTADSDNDSEVFGDLIEFSRLPWDYTDEGDVALLYSLTGKVSANASANVPLSHGFKFGLGLSKETDIAVRHLRVHDADSPLNSAIKSDLLDGFKVPIFPESILSMSPNKEYGIIEFESAVGVDAKLTWGELFTSGTGALSAIIPESEPLVFNVDAGAAISAEVRLRSRMQLFSWRKSERVIRLEFRKVSSSQKTLIPSLGVSASIDNPELVEKAVEKIIARSLNYKPSLLRRAKEAVQNYRDSFDLNEHSNVDASLKAVFDTALSRLRLTPGETVSSLTKAAVFDNVKTFLSDGGLPLGANIDSFIEDLSTFKEMLFPELLENDLAQKAASILEFLDFDPNNSFEFLLAIVTDETLAKKIEDWLPSISPLDIASIKQTLEDQLEISKLKTLLDNPVHELVSGLIEENFSLSLDQLYESFIVGNFYKELLGTNTGNLKNLLGSLLKGADIAANNDTLAEVIDDIADSLDIGAIEISDFFDQAKQMVMRAAKRKLELSAQIEFTRLESHEVLLGLDYIDPQSNLPDFKRDYRLLTTGRWRELKNKVTSLPDRFDNIEFLEINRETKRRHYKVGFWGYGASKKPFRDRVEVRNINGDKQLAFANEMILGGKKPGGVGIGPPRAWTYGMELVSLMGGFSDSPTGDDFNSRLKLTLEYSGKIKPAKFKKNAARNNRATFAFLPHVVGASNKNSFEPEEAVAKFDSIIKPKKTPVVTIVVEMDDTALKWLWAEGMNDLRINYEEILPLAYSLRLFENFIEGTTQPTDDQYAAFDALATLGKAITDNESASSIEKLSIYWTKAFRKANRDWGGSDDFLFKFCFMYAISKTIPAKIPGWNVSAKLKADEGATKEFIFV